MGQLQKKKKRFFFFFFFFSFWFCPNCNRRPPYRCKPSRSQANVLLQNQNIPPLVVKNTNWPFPPYYKSPTHRASIKPTWRVASPLRPQSQSPPSLLPLSPKSGTWSNSKTSTTSGQSSTRAIMSRVPPMRPTLSNGPLRMALSRRWSRKSIRYSRCFLLPSPTSSCSSCIPCCWHGSFL